jgi:hypothetical protein
VRSTKSPRVTEPKTLKLTEIKAICEESGLERSEVYRLKSIFTGMCQLDGTDQGISIPFFCKSCSFLSMAMPEIAIRVLSATGLDVSNPTTVVSWESFLKLYCMFETGASKVERHKVVHFWARFFDLECKGFCEAEFYLDLLEKLVRGKSMPTTS